MDEILNLIESVSDGFPSYFLKRPMLRLIRGGALREGGGGNSPSPLMAFLNIHVLDIFTTY